MYQVHKSIDVDFAHHIRGHSGACINIHGHTWKFEVAVRAKELSPQGFVVDFSELKNKVLVPCHKLLDHSLAIGAATYQDIGNHLEPVGAGHLSSRKEKGPCVLEPIKLHGAENRFPGGMKVTVFPFNPTSERIAKWLYELATQILNDGRAKVSYARIYETLHPVEAVAEFRG